MKSIGGYFQLELSKRSDYPFRKLLHLNSARNCIEYILQKRRIKKVYIPYYTCDVILEPIRKLNIELQFYDIDNNLEPIFDFAQIRDDEIVIVNNYFGVKTDYINKLAKITNKLIIDNAQALFAPVIKGVDMVYSPRKFVGVADGGLLATNIALDDSLIYDKSYNRMSHLLKRTDVSAEYGYTDFVDNDNSIIEQPIKLMSKLTTEVLQAIDYQIIKIKRRNNYIHLNNALHSLNRLDARISTSDVPLVYPLYIDNGFELRRKLIKNNIYIATYWPNVIEWCDKTTNSSSLANDLIALPIDQRYGEEDMNRIINLIK